MPITPRMATIPQTSKNIQEPAVISLVLSIISLMNLISSLAFTLFNYLKELIAGEASAKQVGGPIMIAKYSYSFFRAGFVSMLSFMAFISLQLGIIYLFPVPVFDGGQMLVLSIEGLFRRDFSPKVKQIVMMIGFAIFIFLLGFLILNDVARTLPNGWESYLFWKK